MTRCLRLVLLFLGFTLVSTSICADRAFAQIAAKAPAHHWSYSGPEARRIGAIRSPLRALQGRQAPISGQY